MDTKRALKLDNFFSTFKQFQMQCYLIFPIKKILQDEKKNSPEMEKKMIKEDKDGL